MPRPNRSGHLSAVKSGKLQFIALFDGCCGAAAPLASPGGKLSQNRLFGTDFVTDEECGQKCFVFYAATGFFLHFRYRRSSSAFFIALGGGDEKSTFPPGEGFAPCGARRLESKPPYTYIFNRATNRRLRAD